MQLCVDILSINYNELYDCSKFFSKVNHVWFSSIRPGIPTFRVKTLISKRTPDNGNWNHSV